MKEVKLKLTSKNDKEEHVVEASFSETDLEVFRQFTENVEQLYHTRLVSNGLPSLKRLSWNDESGITVETNDIEMEDVYAFLHKLRPHILQKEPASFERTCSIIGKRFHSPEMRQHLKYVRNLYNKGEYSKYFQLSVGNLPLFSDEALSHWLNGIEYHQDSEKRKSVKEIEETISDKSARAIFLVQLTQKANAIFLLYALVQLLITDKDT
ncbi:hypothetical protein THIOM_003400 [Candidatus Thiomargarita nelsonii]|uniref:Uncharacterized protein n=1 Tax=Candidatus Thiomargarita nelsonii TaxID=1003181 RepID=A0A0A6P2G7_9GAMM|nr:hypothetical protein THIOM_003400 [Candidatus Thiomargarita nelsonii]